MEAAASALSLLRIWLQIVVQSTKQPDVKVYR
jgi:hypothetical protein